MKRYTIGFDNDGNWNGICGTCGLRNAQKLAAEVAVEYGEMPEIREVPTENPWKYAVKGRDNNGDTRTLQHAATRTEAAEAKADFQRTRGDEFRRIWIEKVA